MKTSCPRYEGTHAEDNWRAFALEEIGTAARRGINLRRKIIIPRYNSQHTRILPTRDKSADCLTSRVRAEHARSGALSEPRAVIKNRRDMTWQAWIYSSPDISRLSGILYKSSISFTPDLLTLRSRLPRLTVNTLMNIPQYRILY